MISLLYNLLELLRSFISKSDFSSIGNILIVCKGNICRSPYAKKRLEDGLIKRGLVRINVISAGLDTTEGKPVDAMALEISKNRGLDLSEEKTSELSSEMVLKADLILVMEAKQKYSLIKKYPQASRKVYCLGAMIKRNLKISIFDPYGLSKNDFEKCFNQIDSAVSSLIERLTSRT